jgi:multidrug efflux pump subunit AcrB
MSTSSKLNVGKPKLGISAWAIRNPTPVILLFALLSLIGIYSYTRLPITGNPKIEFPIVSVSVALPGAQPQELEQNVAIRIENALTGVAGLRHLNTTIADGTVEVTVEFTLETAIEVALADVREAITRLRPELPQALGEPLVTRVDVSGGAVQSYAVRAPSLSPLALYRVLEDELKPLLLAVPGVQAVRQSGAAQRELRVELIPERLSALGLSVEEVLRQLRGAEQNLPAGTVRRGDTRVGLRVLSASTSAQALAARQISLGLGNGADVGAGSQAGAPGADAGKRVRLDAIAYVLDGPSVTDSFALLDGEPAVIIDIDKGRGVSEVSLAQGVTVALAEFQRSHPHISFDLYYDAVTSTFEKFIGARDTLIEGTILTILVVLYFLRDWRATAIAAVAIPLSLLPTFAAMYCLGFYLDQVSLLALILVVGILVDDAIVEVENIARRIHSGLSPYQAALEGADDIGLAVLAITLVIVAVFLPVSFIGGVIGKYFVEFGLTTTAAVLSSLLVARMVTPLLCARWLKATSSNALHATNERPVGALQRHYERVLAALLINPARTASLTVAIVLLSACLLIALPTGFLPKTRTDAVSLELQLPPGSEIHRSVAVAEALRASITQLADVDRVFASDRGNGGITLRVILAPAARQTMPRESTVEGIRMAAAELIDVRSNLVLTEDGKEFRLDFASTDGAALDAFIDALSAQAAPLALFRDVETTRGNLQPVLDVRPNSDEMARLGVSAEELSSALRLATLSELDAQLTRVPIDGVLVPIRVRLAGGERLDLARIRDLPIATRGGLVPLSSVASLQNASAASRIERLDRKRTVAITANLRGATIGEAQAALMSLPAFKNKPASVQLAAFGDSALMEEMFVGFGLAMALGLLAVYAVLVLLFSDWLQPLTIMAALPLSLGGAAAALHMTGHSLNLSTMIGVLMLFGITAKNSILLVDFIVEARGSGMPRDEAILKSARERARPIVMTTLAMVGGMLPAAIGIGADDGFRAPMAVAVIGGLLASTALSLLLVPWIYLMLDTFRERAARVAGRLSGRATASLNHQEHTHA